MYKNTIVFSLVIGLLFFACTPASKYTSDVTVIAHGKELFELQCTSCHNFKNAGIGPNLAGITTQISADWLKHFVQNPAEMIDGGDERAVQLYKNYKTYMPAFGMLPETDIDAILAFLHTHQEVADNSANAQFGPALENPIPDTVPLSDIVLQLHQVALAPPTAEKSPVARINKMVPLPGNPKREFIHDLNGVLYELKGGKLLPFLKMTDYFPEFINTPGLATGLGSYAFHPEFLSNGLFYTNHTEDPATSAPADFTFSDTIPRKVRWVLTEWKMDDPKASVFSGNKRELMRVDYVTQIHGMQDLEFNPLARPGDADYGMLYIGTGDGGAAENRYAFLVQHKTKIWGNILRIDPAGNNSKNGHYGIPADNPFVGEMANGALGEIWAMGFRNPHYLIWDTGGDGKLLASDIGHSNIEELNHIEPGRNYGWPEREGTFLIDKLGSLDNVYPLPEDDAAAGFTYPVLQFDHDEAAAICSGYVYYGEQLPGLKGKYFFGGIVNGRIFCANAADFKLGSQAAFQEVRLQLDNGAITTLRDLTANKRVDLRFGINGQGELYILTKADGKVYEVVGTSKPAM